MERAVAWKPLYSEERREKTRLGLKKLVWVVRKKVLRSPKLDWDGDRDLFWFVQARPRPYFFGAGIVGAYFLLAQQNFGTEFSTLEKIWSRSIFDIQTRPRAPCCGTGFGVKCNRRVPGGTRVAFCLSKLRGLRVP